MVSTSPSSTSFNLDQIRPQIQDLQLQLVEWRRNFHQYPELGFQEHLTSEFVAQKLKSWGIDHQTGVAKTGIVATIPSNHPGVGKDSKLYPGR